MPQHRRPRYTQDAKYAVLAGLLLLAVVGILIIVSTAPPR
jgi:hypothetical protein